MTSFANTLRDQGVEVLLLTGLPDTTLDIKEAKTWLLETQISDYRSDLPLRAMCAAGWRTCRTVNWRED